MKKIDILAFAIFATLILSSFATAGQAREDLILKTILGGAVFLFIRQTHYFTTVHNYAAALK